MSSPAEADKVEDVEFKWGKKRGLGGKKKEVQFYDSFIYDGLEYILHDCVYLYKEGEPEPYIGKIIKIWQNQDKSKKVKVLWFFRPREILTWFNDEETPDNELFLACGEGVGLANVNPLEAIAGKCNVVCISKDNRNPQPSEEQLQMAEFVFYRTFDVGRHTVSDKIDDKIAGVDVKFVFNRIESEKPGGFLNLDTDRKENVGNAVPDNETPMTGGKLGPGMEDTITSKSKYELGPGMEDKITSKSKYDADEGEGTSGKVIPNQVEVGDKVKAIEASGDLDTRPFKKAKVDSSNKFSEDKNKNVIQNSSIEKITVKQGNPLEDSTTPKSNIDSDKGEDNVGEKVKAKRVSDDLEPSSFKKAKVDCPIKSSEDKNRNVLQKSNINSDGVNVKAVPIITVSENRPKSKLAKDSHGLDDNLSKKLKSDEKMPEVSNGKLLKASNIRSPEKDTKVKSKSDEKMPAPSNGRLVKASNKSAEKMPEPSNGKLVKASNIQSPERDNNIRSPEKDPKVKSKSDEKMPEPSNGRLVKASNKSDEKMPEPSNGKLVKASNTRSPERDNKVDTQVMEVTRRPDADRRRWFKGLPWEERIQKAYKQETLVLLENLDPAYTSAEVEDLAWHAFKESCTAKMIQRTGITSPHSGQAFVIFKTREAAEKVVKKLRQGCLMLSAGRPLVGSFGTPCPPEKDSTLVGHLVIDKPKQMQRDMKEAVSTSHCSQPNTIEYEMAMEWCLLQDRSESSWRKMYKRQGDVIRKVKAELKSK